MNLWAIALPCLIYLATFGTCSGLQQAVGDGPS